MLLPKRELWLIDSCHASLGAEALPITNLHRGVLDHHTEQLDTDFGPNTAAHREARVRRPIAGCLHPKTRVAAWPCRRCHRGVGAELRSVVANELGMHRPLRPLTARRDYRQRGQAGAIALGDLNAA